MFSIIDKISVQTNSEPEIDKKKKEEGFFFMRKIGTGGIEAIQGNGALSRM